MRSLSRPRSTTEDRPGRKSRSRSIGDDNGGGCRRFSVDGALRRRRWRRPLQRAGSIGLPRSAPRLAVHGDDLAGERTHRGRPGGETSLQRLRVEQPEDLAQGLGGGDAVFKRQIAPQPIQGPAATPRRRSNRRPRRRRRQGPSAKSRRADRSRHHAGDAVVRHNPHMSQEIRHYGAFPRAPSNPT